MQYKVGKKNLLTNTITWLTTLDDELQQFSHQQASQHVSLNNRICKDRAINNTQFVMLDITSEDLISN